MMMKIGKVVMLNKFNLCLFVELYLDDVSVFGIVVKDSVEICLVCGCVVLLVVVIECVWCGNCFVLMYWNDVYGDDLCINVVMNDVIDFEL